MSTVHPLPQGQQCFGAQSLADVSPRGDGYLQPSLILLEHQQRPSFVAPPSHEHSALLARGVLREVDPESDGVSIVYSEYSV
jgi:hypothetical protein